MDYQKIGSVITVIGFISVIIGPNWLTAIGCSIGPALLFYGDRFNKKPK